MSSLNDQEILITFEELRQLDRTDISFCVDKYSALRICENSSASSSEIYNIWVQKLLKAYDLSEFSSKDWHKIIDYLSNVLKKFVNNFNTTNDTSLSQLEQWWMDSQDLLKWLETIINTIDVRVLSLIFTFVLEIIIKTCKFANKRNLKTLCSLQQLVITLANNFISKITITDVEEYECFNKVISSLCDIGSLISSADVRTSIETWRIIVKLSEKNNSCYKLFPVIKRENCTDDNKHWLEKAILGIFKELHEILRIYNRTSPSNNENLLQIAQFYLKILKLLTNHSKNQLETFPALNEFIEVYTLCQHEIVQKENHKIDLFVKKGLFDIFSLIHDERSMSKLILGHLKHDVEHFKSCDLILDYLKIYIDSCSTSYPNFELDVKIVIKLYNHLFEGSLLFIDAEKYSKILEYFVLLAVLDSSNELHMRFCEYVMKSPWIQSFTSMEILTIYYSYILSPKKGDTNLKCLKFWLNIWNKANKSNESHKQKTRLIEILLKTIIQHINEDELQEHDCSKIENIEIILLKSGQQNEKNLQYLQTNLIESLNKMQKRQLNRRSYKKLINLLDISVLYPLLISNNLKEHLLVSFIGSFSLSTTAMQEFYEFIAKCLQIFLLQHNEELNNKLLKHFMQHEQHCCNIQSPFLIQFLFKLRPHSNKLIDTLKNNHNELTIKLINLLDTRNISLHKTIDLNVFKDLPYKDSSLQSNSPFSDAMQIQKKPRLDKGNFSNIKFILNDLNLSTQKLLNSNYSTFDANDVELLQEIKTNIEKCLKS